MEERMNKIAIIGKGKVGTATAKALNVEVDWHDPIKQERIIDFYKYEYVLVCVDTLQEGGSDHNHLNAALGYLRLRKYSGTVVIRSTVNPQWVGYFETLYPELDFVIFPEFMVQRGDVINDKPWQIVLGGEQLIVSDFYALLLQWGYCPKDTPVIITDAKTAAMIKLSANSALAAKVTLFNAIYLACATLGVDYETVRRGVVSDQRIGAGHTTVPSPDDGQLGFGGHCLPKDLWAMVELDHTGYFDNVQQMNWQLGR
jgi:UDPglucose 6-dehydrogenase